MRSSVKQFPIKIGAISNNFSTSNKYQKTDMSLCMKNKLAALAESF